MKKLMLLVGAMSASMVWAENVSYRYYDATEKTFKTSSADCTDSAGFASTLPGNSHAVMSYVVQ